MGITGHRHSFTTETESGKGGRPAISEALRVGVSREETFGWRWNRQGLYAGETNLFGELK
jgi:hypothetical protein